MSAFAETSFLFAFYFPRSSSEQALLKVQTLSSPALISSLVRYEFQQAVWFEVWRRTNGQPRGMSQLDAQTGLAMSDIDLEQGLWWDMARPDWEGVIARSQRLTEGHTSKTGARSLDILHVATAQELAVTEFLTFDLNQRRIAATEGLPVSP